MTVLWRWVVLEMVVVSPVSSRRGFYRAWKSMGGRRKAQSGTGSDSSGKAVGPLSATLTLGLWGWNPEGEGRGTAWVTKPTRGRGRANPKLHPSLNAARNGKRESPGSVSMADVWLKSRDHSAQLSISALSTQPGAVDVEKR